MSAYWCDLAWLGGERAEPGVLVEVEGETIASVTPRVPSAPAGTIRLAGLTIPGLANAHSHAFHRALRGRTQAERGSFWTWRERMYAVAERLDPASYLALARATYGEMALAGITVVGEFHYLHHGPGGEPYADPNEIGSALIEAAGAAGIRITLLDTCYLRGGIDAPLDEVQRRFADADADAWTTRVEGLAPGAGVRIGAAIHSVRAVDPEAAARVAAWAAAAAAPLHAHVSEQPAENEACRAAYGMTPTQLLSEAGAIDARFTAIHATHVDDGDIRVLGGAGATCCLCPTTERDLADGVGPARELAGAGCALALGSDSHAVIDLLEEARAVELDERLVSGERGRHGAAELLAAATAAGNAALGWEGGGRIAPGAIADLATIRLDGVRLAGCGPENAVEAAVFAGTAADIGDVVARGRHLVRDGRHVEIDVVAELTEAIARVNA